MHAVGNPTRNVFGWQRPCYLLAEGYASSFKGSWQRPTGTATAPEATRNAPTAWRIAATVTAVSDAIVHPLKALRTAVGRIRTEGPMAPEIPLDGQPGGVRARPAGQRALPVCPSARTRS